MGAGWDVIVVGARCAGSPLAMLLARMGYRVMLADRGTFPSDTVSSHGLLNTGHARLHGWGLLDRLLDTGPGVGDAVEFHVGGAVIHGVCTPVNGISSGSGPRRHVLDDLLVRAAAESGAEVRTGFSVNGLVLDGERVAGVRARLRAGGEATETAQLVVGADGKFSTVARLVGASKYRDDGNRTCQYYGYWSGTSLDRPRYFVFDDWGIATGPTHGGLSIMSMAVSLASLSAFRADVEAAFMARVNSAPELRELVGAGRREEHFRGLADVPNYRRQSYGPGWALVGDAGYDRDPVTAQGISDAFRDADTLAGAIDDGLSGRQDMQVALDGYQKARDAATEAMYEWTLVSTAFVPDRESSRALMRQIADDPELSQMFVDLNPGLADYRTMLGLAAQRAG